ncbi:MAG: hypothetical protein ACR2P2_11230 [Nakamurella sp.]
MADNPQDRLARALIDDAYTAMVDELRQKAESAEADARFARNSLARAQAQREAWRRHRVFQHVVGFRAVTLAQVADMTDTSAPAGFHLEALSGYLNKYHAAKLPAPGKRAVTSRDGRWPLPRGLRRRR